MFDKADAKDFDILVAENRFVTDIQLVIERAMDEAGLSQADLARALEVTEANVSQMLSDTGRNFKARTIARIAHVLGLCPAIEFVDKNSYGAIRKSARIGRNPKIDNSEIREWVSLLEGCPSRQWQMACNDDEALMDLEVA